MPKKKNIIETLTSGYWLLAALTGAFISFFTLNCGGVVVFIEAGFAFVLLSLITGQYKLKQIPWFYWVTLGICLYLIVFGQLFASHEITARYVRYLVRMLFVVFTIHCLSLEKIDPRIYDFLPIVWCLTVCWQFAAVNFFNMPFGTYTNRHYLANLIILILPLLVYSFWISKHWYKWILIPIALLVVDMLLRSGSRTAFLAIFVAVVFALIFISKSRTKWIGLSMIAFASAILYFSNYGGAADRVKELLVNLADEERVYFWQSAFQMLNNNTIVDWIFGNGIGGYRDVYPDYASPKFRHFWFAHLHPLEILYENGIIGVILVYGGLTVLFGSCVKASANTFSKNTARLINCMAVILLCWMIHSNLTFPFYSKYAQYPLGFILGTMLAMIGQSRLSAKTPAAAAKN